MNLLEHRDDPFPPRPGAEELAAAVRRGKQLELRRRLALTSAAAGVVALLAFGAAVGFRGGGDQVRSAAVPGATTPGPADASDGAATAGADREPAPTGSTVAAEPPAASVAPAVAGADSLSLVVDLPEEVVTPGTTRVDLTVTNTSTAPLAASLTHLDVQFTFPDGHTEAIEQIPLPDNWTDFRLGPNEHVEWRSDPYPIFTTPGTYSVRALLTGPSGEAALTTPETVQVVGQPA